MLFGGTNKGKTTFKDIKQQYPQLTVIMLTNTVIEKDFRLEDYPGCAFAFAKNQLNSGTEIIYSEFAEKIRRAIKNSDITLWSHYKRSLCLLWAKQKQWKKCAGTF